MTNLPIWFERPIIPNHIDHVEATCIPVGYARSLEAAEAESELATARGVIAGTGLWDAAHMDQAPMLQVIGRSGIGYDSVDVPAATERGIAVVNAPNGPTVSTAEHAVMLILMAAKDASASAQRLRRAEPNTYMSTQGIELHGKTLGIVGLGRIGRRVATICRAIGMRVVACDPYVDDNRWLPEVERAADLDALLPQCDVLSLHTPLTDETRGFMNAERLAQLPAGAYLVNSSRGGVLDLDALGSALDSGRLTAAALDVTEPEPLPPDHPLFERDNVFITPHSATANPTARGNNFIIAYNQILQVFAGEQPPHLVNTDVWPNRRQP